MPAHEAGATTGLLTSWLLGVALVLLLAAYLAVVRRGRARGRAWPRRRVACAASGTVVCLLALLVPARAGHHDIVLHMWGHLLLGMVGPLLLVLAAPVTAALRGLPVGAARRLTAVLRRRWVAALSHPVVAATLNGAGLWALYTTPLHGWMHASALVHLLVHAHVLLAGLLLTASVLQVDPAPHPVGHGLRAVVLVGFVALHGIVAKQLYAHPPPGVPEVSAQTAAQLMYYGGDAVDVALMTLLCWDWYRRSAEAAPLVPGGRVRRWSTEG